MRRRDFLKIVAASPLIANTPNLLANAQTPPLWQKKLVLIELKGGNDGLNTIVPYSDRTYYRYRPTIAVDRDNIIPLNHQLGLNSSLEKLRSAWGDDELAIMLGVGYDNPSLSHFRSIEIWNTASKSNQVLDAGWLARALSNKTVTKHAISEGICLSFDTGPFMGENSHVIVMHNPKGFIAQAKHIKPSRKTSNNPALQHILAVQNEIQSAASEIERRISGTEIKMGEFPNTKIGNQLKIAAQLIAADIPVPVIKLEHSGFDTHSNQLNNHNRLLLQLAEALDAFKKSVVKADKWKQTLVMTYSEFGRRPAENGSRGTDHGTSAPHFLLGGAVKGGFYGQQPRLSELQAGNITHHLDFRALYATVLQKWWGLNPGESGVSYPALDCLRT